MRVLGIDPGLRSTGYAIIDIEHNQYNLIVGGCVNTKTSEKRLAKIYNHLHQIIIDYRPDMAIVEHTYININPRTSLSLGQARGVCIVSLENNNIEYMEMSTVVIRKNLLGKGNATKEEVQEFIGKLFNMKMSNHISDAIASILAAYKDHIYIDYEKIISQ